MKLVSWNIRGLNSKGKLRYLKEQIYKEKPDIIILRETKVTLEKYDEIIGRS